MPSPALPEEFGNPWMSNLEEITPPEPVPFTPETVGWDLVALFVLLGIAWLVFRFWRRWQANGYRRAALKELDAMKGAPQGVPELLKRVALVSYPRTEVARLSGDDWLGFLDHSLGESGFTQGPGRCLPQLAYDPGFAAMMNASETDELLSLVRRWIRRHR